MHLGVKRKFNRSLPASAHPPRRPLTSMGKILIPSETPKFGISENVINMNWPLYCCAYHLIEGGGGFWGGGDFSCPKRLKIVNLIWLYMLENCQHYICYNSVSKWKVHVCPSFLNKNTFILKIFWNKKLIFLNFLLIFCKNSWNSLG